jgi:hypothetical protein
VGCYPGNNIIFTAATGTHSQLEWVPATAVNAKPYVVAGLNGSNWADAGANPRRGTACPGGRQGRRVPPRRPLSWPRAEPPDASVRPSRHAATPSHHSADSRGVRGGTVRRLPVVSKAAARASRALSS